MRSNNRSANELRSVKITTDFNKYAEGSVLVEFGDTRVICMATLDEKVPNFMKGQGKGWVTAEYSMLPRATQVRNQREAARGKLGGRTMEIQRLIGRSLRSVVNLEHMGERTLTLDCDVIQADGGTRTASITGAFVAMATAMHKLHTARPFKTFPISDFLSAVSVGVVDDQALLDLDYSEDSRAKVDMNVVMTGAGKFVEVQGTGEESPFSREELNELLALSEIGNLALIERQKEAIGAVVSRLIGGKARAVNK